MLITFHCIAEGPNAGDSPAEPMAFSFGKTKEAIRAAVQEAAALERSEGHKRIKLLRLRWHPGAQSVMNELAHAISSSQGLSILPFLPSTIPAC